MATQKKVRIRSPFRSIDALEEDIIVFMNRHKLQIAEHSRRMSNYFEMSCFNYIIKYYEHRKYKVEAENLQHNRYKYKCSPAGYQDRFSNFKVSRNFKNAYYEFGIYHNLSIASAHHDQIFLTPDISIINYSAIKINEHHYSLNKKLYYARNEDLISFAEAKQFPPFPELVFNFIGIVNELKVDVMKGEQTTLYPGHIAPSIMISGKPNQHVLKIKEALEHRYCINIIYDLFASIHHPFSSSLISSIRSIEEKKIPLTVGHIFRSDDPEDKEALPF